MPHLNLTERDQDLQCSLQCQNVTIFTLQVSEGSPRHTSVVTVSARDPEGETVNYSIISGNNQGHFSIGESTGVVRVMEELDREETNRYSLVSEKCLTGM